MKGQEKETLILITQLDFVEDQLRCEYTTPHIKVKEGDIVFVQYRGDRLEAKGVVIAVITAPQEIADMCENIAYKKEHKRCRER